MRTPLFALKFLKKYFRVISKKKENKIVRRRLFNQRIGSELTPYVITTGNGTFLYYVCYVLSFSTSFLKIELRKNNHHVKNRHANFLAVAKRGVIFRFAIYAIKNWLIWNLAAA